MLRANGDRVTQGSALCTLSDAALLRGDAAAALAFARSALEVLATTHARDREVDALLKRGQAELALGRSAEARATFAQMHGKACEIDSAWQHDATAGLAQVALAEGDDAAALREVESLAAHMSSGGTLVGTVKPRLIELTCHRVLARLRDPRAGEWLERAREGLEAQAATIPDAALRRRFLDDIPYHREIASTWAALKERPATAT